MPGKKVSELSSYAAPENLTDLGNARRLVGSVTAMIFGIVTARVAYMTGHRRWETGFLVGK